MVPTTFTMQPGAEGRALTSPPSTTLRRTAELERTVDVSGLVDAEGGLLDRALFTDESIYRQEQRRIFATHWLFLAHTDQFRKPGDFFTTYMGEDPVIVTMDKNRDLDVSELVPASGPRVCPRGTRRHPQLHLHVSRVGV